jgi:hypothetical protein
MSVGELARRRPAHRPVMLPDELVLCGCGCGQPTNLSHLLAVAAFEAGLSTPAFAAMVGLQIPYIKNLRRSHYKASPPAYRWGHRRPRPESPQTHLCQRCRHRWVPRSTLGSSRCPACRTLDADSPPRDRRYCVRGHNITGDGSYYWKAKDGTTRTRCRKCQLDAQKGRFRVGANWSNSRLKVAYQEWMPVPDPGYWTDPVVVVVDNPISMSEAEVLALARRAPLVPDGFIAGLADGTLLLVEDDQGVRFMRRRAQPWWDGVGGGVGSTTAISSATTWGRGRPRHHKRRGRQGGSNPGGSRGSRKPKATR